MCKVRGVAYSTFSVIHVNGKGEGVLFEFDNPQAILIRGEKCSDLPREAMNILGKTVYKSPLALQKDDVIVVMSDGVIHAGIGMTLNLGLAAPRGQRLSRPNGEKGHERARRRLSFGGRVQRLVSG